jgi:hypothetical protein
MRRPAVSGFLVAYFGLIAVGLVAAAALGLGLAWDGSSLLVTSLDNGAPFVFFLRLVEFPLQLPAVAVASVTHSLRLIGFAFGLGYFGMPLAALLASWWVVGREHRRLFVWAALGVGLAALPAQIFAVSEAVIAVQLTWPLFLAVVTDSVPRNWPIVATIGLFVAFTAPIAAVLLLGLAATSAGLAVAARRGRRDLRPAALFAVLAVVAGIAAVAGGDVASHSSEITLGVLVARFYSALQGWPVISLLATYAAGVLLVGGAAVRRRRPMLAGRLEMAAVVAVAAAATALVAWATDVHAWSTALDARTLLPFIVAPLMALAIADSRIGAPAAGTAEPTPAQRRIGLREWIALEQAAAMLVVLVAVALGWSSLTSRLAAEMAAAPAGCVDRAPMLWIDGTALDHWSVSAESMLLSGQRPTRIVLSTCAVSFTNGVHVAPWTLRRYVGGWFDLAGLRRALTAR